MDKEIIIDIENPKDNNLINRQALLKLMGEEPFNWTDSDQELQAVEDYRNFRDMVEQLPSVKPQEKTGHWIWQTEDIYQCSECGEDIHVKEVMNKPQYAWCPICGCPMEIER